MQTESGEQPHLIDFTNAIVLRGDRIVLNKLNLCVPSGEHVAILGPNGSGKSTLIKTITRECYPLPVAEGPPPLRILGNHLWNIFELRPLLGIVANDVLRTTAQDFTAREVVLSGFFSSIGIWPWHHVTATMERKADEVLEVLGITHLRDRWIDELSSGETRRVVIGRALVHDPKALIFDEPTNSLDLHALHGVRDLMRSIAQMGTTVILVTHHLADIIPEIGRVVLFDGGRVAADGPKASVLTNDALSRVFRVPVEISERNGYYHAW